jgi:hypothetical protein
MPNCCRYRSRWWSSAERWACRSPSTSMHSRAVEVEEVGTDGRLASEVEADLVAAQALPEAFFRLAHLTAHLAGACDTVGLPVAVRHTLSVRYRRRGSCWILPPSVRSDKGTSLRFTSRRKTQNFTIYTQHTTPTLHHQRHQP